MNIYIGNLSYGMSEDELRQAFSAFGEVSSVKILMDRDTGRSRGFGFVEMPNQSEAEAAEVKCGGSLRTSLPGCFEVGRRRKRRAVRSGCGLCRAGAAAAVRWL